MMAVLGQGSVWQSTEIYVTEHVACRISEAHGKLSHTLDGHRWKKRSEFFLIRLQMLVKKKALRTFTMKYNFINQHVVLF